jgi:hypothetical protein
MTASHPVREGGFMLLKGEKEDTIYGLFS